ncbi:MAG: S1/P1 nuclease [Flavobacteriaceae bacterium]
MKFSLLILLLMSHSTFLLNVNEDWDKTGHRAIAQVAEMRLKKKVKKTVDYLLDGETLALASTYADEIKSDKKYRAYYSWHYINMAADENYMTVEKNPKGDIVTAIRTCIEEVKNVNNTKAIRAFHLRLLIHFIGDLHQPMHVGRKEDRGGNGVRLKWFGQSTNLHRVWDSNMIDYYKMSYMELSQNLPQLTRQEEKAIEESSLLDWVEESHQLANMIYADAEGKENLSYAYPYQHFPLVRLQLLKGGIRLADILNKILA